ncbi:MAG: hypothetical protein O3A77_02775 [bacterium]|nr:hypothetical protein [bacterium]
MRKKALIIAAIGVGLWGIVSLFFLDSWVKTGLIRSLETANGAPVHIESVDVSVLPLHVSIEALTLVDANKPDMHWLTIKHAHVGLRFLPLLSKKLIIDSVEIADFMTHQPRDTSPSQTNQANTESNKTKSAPPQSIDLGEFITAQGLDSKKLEALIRDRGNVYLEYYNQVSAWIQRYREAKHKPQSESGFLGQTIDLADTSPWPQLWIRSITASGQHGNAMVNLAIRNVTTDQVKINRPTTVDGHTQAKDRVTTLNITIDARQEPTQTQIVFTRVDPEFQNPSITHAHLATEGHIRIEDQALSGRITTVAQPLQINPDAITDDTVSDIVSMVDQTTLDIDLGGTVTQPAIGVACDIDQHIRRAANRAVQREADRLKRQVESQVEAKKQELDAEINRSIQTETQKIKNQLHQQLNNLF